MLVGGMLELHGGFTRDFIPLSLSVLAVEEETYAPLEAQAQKGVCVAWSQWSRYNYQFYRWLCHDGTHFSRPFRIYECVLCHDDMLHVFRLPFYTISQY